MMDFKQFDNDDNETDTEVPLNDNQDLVKIINDIKSTFNYSLQFREK